MTALEDEENQRKGFVLVIYQVGTKGAANVCVTELLRKAPFMKGAMPIRLVAVHYCLDDSVIHTVLNLLQVVLGKQYQLRFRSHYGKPEWSPLLISFEGHDLTTCSYSQLQAPTWNRSTP